MTSEMTEVFFYGFFVCAGCLLGMAFRYLAARAMKENYGGKAEEEIS